MLCDTKNSITGLPKGEGGKKKISAFTSNTMPQHKRLANGKRSIKKMHQWLDFSSSITDQSL